MTVLLGLILILLIFLFLFYLLMIGFAIFDLFGQAPFVPTKAETVEKMVKLAQVKKGDKAIDLGSGDGRLVIAAARAGAIAIGIEKNPFLILLSRIKIKLTKVKAKIIWGDIFKTDLSKADIVFLYLNPKLLAKLAPKLEKELETGLKVVSNRYPIPNWKPVKNFDKIFLYFK